VQKVPADGDAWERRAFAHRNLKQYKEAIADYTKAISIDPKDADGYRRRAQAYILAGDSVKAAEDFKAILKIKPDDVDAQSRLKALETRSANPTPPVATTPYMRASPSATKPATSPATAPPAASPR
jgi:tetratricopeptide (TPR) repeat protein